MITETDFSSSLAAVCPVAPPGAQVHVDELHGYILWGVIALMIAGMAVAVGAVVGGRVFSMPHASKVGIISVFVVLGAAIAYLILPGILDGFLGDGCV